MNEIRNRLGYNVTWSNLRFT